MELSTRLMHRFVVFLALLGLILALPGTARAQRVESASDQSSSSSGPSDRIIAVVNDNIITSVDLESRIRLAMLSSGLPETSEVAHRLFPQVLHSLIDEQLQMQEAKRIDVSVSADEIDKALEHISRENNLPSDMKSYVASHGVPPETLIAQIRAVITWNKVIQHELRPRIEVGDDEIESAMERIRANAGKEEYLVNEIFLAVDTPQDEDQVRQFADNLVEQLKSGANFGAVARQFSQGTGAASGGDIGWIQEGQLPQELNRAITSMQPGEIAGPIRSANGFHILGLKEKRTIAASSPGVVSLSLQQAVRPLDSDAAKDAALLEADKLRSSITSCNNLQAQLTEKFPAWRLQNMGDVKLDKIPSWAADKIHDVQPGHASEPLPMNNAMLVFFVCDRHVLEGGVDRNAIVNSIGTEKLELQARRLLRDLHRDAYIDIRLPSA